MLNFYAMKTAIAEIASYAEYDYFRKIRVLMAFAIRHGATGD